MLILTIRTDKPEAEIGLYDDSAQLQYVTWQAHRKLAETIHLQIRQLLKTENKALEDIEGIVVFQGPGSFTGLRIGITVANALSDSLGAPIVGSFTEKWLKDGITSIVAGQNDKIIMPEYGQAPHITLQKK